MNMKLRLHIKADRKAKTGDEENDHEVDNVKENLFDNVNQIGYFVDQTEEVSEASELSQNFDDDPKKLPLLLGEEFTAEAPRRTLQDSKIRGNNMVRF